MFVRFMFVCLWLCFHYLRRLVTKPTKWHVRPAKTQISLGIRPVRSESSLSAWRNLGSLATHWAHSEDSDQTVAAHLWSRLFACVLFPLVSRAGCEFRLYRFLIYRCPFFYFIMSSCRNLRPNFLLQPGKIYFFLKKNGHSGLALWAPAGSL